jgi:hypothetical protein
MLPNSGHGAFNPSVMESGREQGIQENNQGGKKRHK